MAKKKLTDKQRAFVEHYLESWNATEAAKLAGYSFKSARVIGPENLSKPAIRAEIERRLSDKAMSANEVLARLTEHGRTDMGAFADLKSAADLHNHPHSRLVKKLKRRIHTTLDGDTDETIEIELHDPQAALVHLGRHHALFTDRHLLGWEDELIPPIKADKITYDVLAAELGDEKAADLFRKAGKPVLVSK